MKDIRGKYLMVLIAMAGLIATSLGILTNISGLFFTPIAEEFGVGRGTVSMTLTISNLVYAAAGMLAPRVFSPKRFKRAVLVCTLCIAGSTAAMSASRGVAALYLLNAVRGFAGGLLGFVLVTIVINNWFHRSAGLANSIAMGCSGLTGAALSPVLSRVIQASGWRAAYLVAAALVAVFNLPALLLPISLRPEDVGALPLEDAGSARRSAPAEERRAVTPTLYLLVVAFAMLSSFITVFPQHLPGLANSYGLSVEIGSFMLSICMAFNTAGKLLFGAFADRFGARRGIALFGALIALSLLTSLCFRAPYAMFAAAALLGLSYAMPTVGAVLITKDVFGLTNYSAVYPSVSLGTTLANAIGASLIGFMYDASGAYTSAISLMLGMCALFIASALDAYGFSSRRGGSQEAP